MSKTLVFVDLDDTIFQTKRKNCEGIIAATNPVDPENTSYMTNYQKIFLDMFLNSSETKVIPTTARNISQYNRTFLSSDSRIDTAITYFSGQILRNNIIDIEWNNYIKTLYEALEFPITKMFELISSITDTDKFKLFNVDNFYITLKNKSKTKSDYTIQNSAVAEQFKSFITPQYYIHFNDNNISILPKFLNKKLAVEYLICEYKPDLTIGIGDSLTDLDFMQVCDYRIFPRNSQIEKELTTSKNHVLVQF